MRTRSIIASLILLATLVTTLAPIAAHAQATPEAATPAADTDIPTDLTALTPEEQLVAMYVPTIGLKDQEAPCDAYGEPFYPVAVDVVLNNPDVTLKRATGSSSRTDEVVVTAPSASDLFAKGSDYYLDFPGNPRKPGCSYEQWFDRIKEGYEPSTYAHIVIDGAGQLVIQYWFYYIFNDFNNTHESDWEMMQIVFPVATVAEALTATPVAVAFAQHGGGETADWDDDKLQRDGTHPIVYASAGSHASQYGQALYLGWGENGTGFGCDVTSSPTTLVPLTPILLPASVTDASSEFAWLAFAGRWGERQGGEYNGPTGPSMKHQWSGPTLWQAELRTDSLEIPAANTFGPAPTNVFCNVTEWGSSLYRRVGDSTPLLLLSAGGIIGVVVVMSWLAMSTIVEAVGIYRRRWPLFVMIGLWLIPVAALFSLAQVLFDRLWVGRLFYGLLNRTPGSYFAGEMATLLVQHLVGLAIILPMVVEGYADLEAGESPTFRTTLMKMVQRLPDLLRIIARAFVILLVASITLVGVPIAIWLAVRWLFAPQAALLDHQRGKLALDRSAQSVNGRWLKVALVDVTLMVLAGSPGVVIGLGLLMLGRTSVQQTNLASSLIYVITVPLALLAMTVLYRQRRPAENDPPPAA